MGVSGLDPKKTYMCIGRIYKLHTERPKGEPPAFSLSDDSSNHCSILLLSDFFHKPEKQLPLSGQLLYKSCIDKDSFQQMSQLIR